MSYPEPKYFGDTGEISAVARRNETPADILFQNGSGEYLAKGAATGGEFGLYRWNMGPKKGGPSAHFHKTISESFYILEGTVTIYNGNEWAPMKKGDFVYVPQGGLHGFRNDTDEPASMLLLFTPGADREPYFEGVAAVGEMTEEERAAFFLEHDNYWVEEA
ncbi:cupin domain-containing protein [Glycomyces algeriensis]|uniref:Cupin n=1 Tax=Glycomyces algeriensis TaxID=256037 RepID=A0A9W6LIN0_9ACTN|nr:cupin domain-containing protein [Glycomyces algeriensis]MDA1368196.1 cupin domain-containing protein [Glycomyces algeriensis]MDR7351836.1 mannose-6-phosphate isomerase-like protein (cupin superfamily) [Glycomyces algeriensis]GLI44565.1 cupin [Glycomyces algeriensis]